MGKEADRRSGGSGVPTNPEVPRGPETEPGELQMGQMIAGRYEVRGRLGAGGMGAVYRVLDRELGEEVALKVLRSDWLGDAVSVERFRREVRLARRIGHANVCRVFDLGEADGLRFLTMERVEGRSLRAVLREGTPPPRQALDMFLQIVDGVAAAHELGIVHRDLKPENVLIDRNGRWRLTDFGIAHGPGIMERQGSTGTPEFAAPEQIMGEPQGPGVDLFALAAIVTFTLTGRPPFGTGDARVIVARQLKNELDVDGVPAPLLPFLERALAPHAEIRFADAREMRTAWHAALDQLQDDSERNNWWWRWLGGN